MVFRYLISISLVFTILFHYDIFLILFMALGYVVKQSFVFDVIYNKALLNKITGEM